MSTPAAGIGKRHPALAPQLHALLVDLPTGLSLFERTDLKLALEDLPRHRVDRVRRRNLKPELRQRVEGEAIAI